MIARLIFDLAQTLRLCFGGAKVLEYRVGARDRVELLEDALLFFDRHTER